MTERGYPSDMRRLRVAVLPLCLILLGSSCTSSSASPPSATLAARFSSSWIKEVNPAGGTGASGFPWVMVKTPSLRTLWSAPPGMKGVSKSFPPGTYVVDLRMTPGCMGLCAQSMCPLKLDLSAGEHASVTFDINSSGAPCASVTTPSGTTPVNFPKQGGPGAIDVNLSSRTQFLQAANGYLYALADRLGHSYSIIRIDPSTHVVSGAPIPVKARAVLGLSVVGKDAWVLTQTTCYGTSCKPQPGTLDRIDLGSGKIVASYPAGIDARSLAATWSGVWVGYPDSGLVRELWAADGRTAPVLHLAGVSSLQASKGLPPCRLTPNL